jgi:hypothetical protein
MVPTRPQPGNYPATSVYKKRAGHTTYAGWMDELGDVLSHEIAHLHQFSDYAQAQNVARSGGRYLFMKNWVKANCRSGSLEVDAEWHARKNQAAFRQHFGIAPPKEAGRVFRRGPGGLTEAERQEIVAMVANQYRALAA